MAAHCAMARAAGIGVLALSWYPPGKADENGRPSDPLVAPLLDACALAGIRLAIHLEPYKDRTPASVALDLEYLVRTYGAHPALHRMPRTPGGPPLPLVYVYDSYHNSPAEWRQLLGPPGKQPPQRGSLKAHGPPGAREYSRSSGGPAVSVRGTASDCFMVCLVVEQGHEGYVRFGGFDGFYSYFAADGFTYGSTTRNWNGLRRLAKETGTAFIPSVGPGYMDTSVRPWNGATTRDRQRGKYYDNMWGAALADGGGGVVSVTSFNEWHEGTQIEPAVPARREVASGPKGAANRAYQDYGGLGASGYLDRTAIWSAKQRQLHLR